MRNEAPLHRACSAETTATLPSPTLPTPPLPFGLARVCPELSRLLGGKTLTEAASKARRLRDAGYTLVMLPERHLRAAADDWYADTHKAREDLAFPPSGGGAAKELVEEGEAAPTEGEGAKRVPG